MSNSTTRSGRSAVEMAAQKICDMIATGRFVAGQRLPEIDLVQQLGVSKTVVREAFAKLQEEGVLELKMFRGAMVRRLTISEIMEILAINTVLMSWGMQQAAAAIAADPSRAEALSVILSNWRTLNPRDQREHLTAFYGLIDEIVSLAGSAYLAKLLQRGLNPLLKEILLDSLSTEPELVEHTRRLEETLKLIVAGEGQAASATFVQWSDVNSQWIRKALEEADGRQP